MKSKILYSSLLMLILSIAIVSATVTITSTTPNSFTKSLTQSSFIVTNHGTDNVRLTLTIPATIDDSKGHSITLSTTSPIIYNNIAPGQSTGAINIAYSGDTALFKIGEFSINIVVKSEQMNPDGTINPSNNMTLNVPVKFINTFCRYGENDSGLSISTVDINTNGEDDYEWRPLDEVTIKVKVENVGTDKISNVNLELGLIDSNGKNTISNMDNLDNKKVSLGTISEDKEKTYEFKFKVPVDFKDENYLFVVKAYKSGKEAEICTSSSSDLESKYFQSISGTRVTDTDKQVVVDNIILSPEEKSQCGDKVQISANVVNIGDEDYLDQVKVTLYNKDLNINLVQEVREDLDQGDSYNIDFEFDVPQNAQEKTYTLEFRTYYDYDEDDNTYGEISSSKFYKTIKIEGNCEKIDTTIPTVPQARITAELDPETPEAVAGKQVIIKSNIKNTGTTESTYTITVYGNSAWSSLVSINPTDVKLAPGESKDVSIVLNVDAAAEGEKEFSIRALSAASDKAVEQKVSLLIVKPSATADYSAVSEHLKKNWFIYLIILVNLILIIAIIAVIRRMVSGPKREY
ncbi:MAG: putative S-layer protein [Nanoarchaeota archaeon]|nr:putative S-layer protein [Nanoarchaeota archaeon]